MLQLTCYENILVGSSNELHSLLREESHVLIDCIVGYI